MASRIAVLGAGLQGACIALELARRGCEVELFEREARVLTGASANNEGKIHLGYVYANDTSFDTARLMIRGATSFAPLLRRWIDGAVDRITVSRPFQYAVHRDSLLTCDELQVRYDAITGLLRDEVGGEAADYFGADPCAPVVRLPPSAQAADFGGHVAGVFQTTELAVDPEDLMAEVGVALAADPRITIHTGATALAVRPQADGASVEIAGHEAGRFDHVVNASWDSLLALDATAGLAPTPGWSFRDKNAIRLVAADQRELPTVTIVLGGFGDVVNYGGGEMYLSWYPVGRRQLSAGMTAHSSAVADEARDALVAGTIAGLSDIVPGVTALAPDALAQARICGGVILATGRTDVDDPDSLLHKRSDIGIRSLGRYHSVNTGKLTTAPLYAAQLADLICGA